MVDTKSPGWNLFIRAMSNIWTIAIAVSLVACVFKLIEHSDSLSWFWATAGLWMPLAFVVLVGFVADFAKGFKQGFTDGKSEK